MMILNNREILGDQQLSSVKRGFSLETVYKSICSMLTVGFVSITIFPSQSIAQQITSAADEIGTNVLTYENRFDITGGSISGDGANLSLSLEKFSLSTGQSANFLAEPDIQNILSRVIGGNASTIDGILKISNSDANLFLINPAGIVFGSNVQLNLAGSFTATTATGIGFGENWFDSFANNDYELLTRTPDGFAFDLSEPNGVVNTGTLELDENQSLMLLGGTVVNTGELTSSEGEITLAAIPSGSILRIDHENMLLNKDLEAIADASNSPGRQLPEGFSPLSLPELLTEASVLATPEIVVDPDGTVRLTATDTVIPTDAGTTIVSGHLEVSGAKGGNVSVLGGQIGLVNGHIDASGMNGGGTVRLGGDSQTEEIVPNSAQTYVGANMLIEADAKVAGDGGQIFVWANETTQFYGEINARGGSSSGDGGLIEVSSRENLAYSGNLDVSSFSGMNGTTQVCLISSCKKNMEE